MASSRINMIRGTTKSYEVNLTDEDGEPLTDDMLIGAYAVADFRVLPDSSSNVLTFDSRTTPLSLAFYRSVLRLNFVPADTAALSIGMYAWRLRVSLANTSVYDAVEWSPFDLSDGGITEETPPQFDNTVAVDQNYGTSDSLRYMTAGGSPIANAQIRVYYKAQYDVGMLNTPVGVTETNADGRWKAPVLVLPGYSYVIQFFKPNEFGPDVSTIIV